MNQKKMILAAFFAALLCISSYIIIPIGLVPHSMQIAFIFLTGLILGKKWASISVLVWFMIGCLGLPVFAGGKAGITTFIGPTGGFLIGFLVSAYLIGFFSERGLTKFKLTFIVFMLGLLVVYVLGTIVFVLSMKYVLNKPLAWDVAIKMVVMPFLPFDLIKAVMAAYIGLRVKRALAYIVPN